MLLAETVAQEVTFYSVLAMLMPVIVLLLRWLFHLSTTQKLVQKSKHAALIDTLVSDGIDMAEQWASNELKKSEGEGKPTADEKKQTALDFIMERGKQLGVPDKLMNRETISKLLEAVFIQKLKEDDQ